MKNRQLLSVCLNQVKNRPLLSVCLVVLLAVAASVLCGEERIIGELRSSPLEAAVPPEETVLVQGQVYRVAPKAESQALYLKNNSIQYQKQIFQESRMIIYTDPNVQVDIGNIVRGEGKV